MKIIKKHTVTEDIESIVRAADYIIENCSFFETKSAVKKAIKKQRILIDGKICLTGTHIKKGQIIELLENNNKTGKVFKLKLAVIYEDDFIAVINKPPGISVSGNYFKTIQNTLSFNLKKTNLEDALEIPLPVHRLDNQTSGLLLIAKTRTARVNLGKQFEEKNIQKKYNAVVIGTPDKKGIINFPVDGKNALTRYELVKTEKSLRNRHLSLINLYPLTGRTHQLRIHCKQSGFPILGDKLYKDDLPVFKGKGLFLSATEISFYHPETKKYMNLSIPYPQKFDKIIEKEKQRYFRKKNNQNFI